MHAKAIQLLRRIWPGRGFRNGAICLAAQLLLAGCAGPAVDFSKARLELVAPSSPGEAAYSEILVLPSAKAVEARLKWPDYLSGVLLEWRWRAPDGTVVQREHRTIFAPEDTARLPIAGSAYATRFGVWTVDVSGAGATVQQRFNLVRDRDQWWALQAQHSHERARALSILCGKQDFDFLFGHFSSALTPAERQVFEQCLQRHGSSVIPSLAEALESAPGNEDLLALAYGIKKRLVAEILGDEEGRGEKLEQLTLLATRWDSELFARLVHAADLDLRLRGIELFTLSGADETVFFLEPLLYDPQPEVRKAAVAVIEKAGGLSAEEALRRRMKVEQDPIIKAQLRRALEAWRGEPR